MKSREMLYSNVNLVSIRSIREKTRFACLKMFIKINIFIYRSGSVVGRGRTGIVGHGCRGRGLGRRGGRCWRTSWGWSSYVEEGCQICKLGKNVMIRKFLDMTWNITSILNYYNNRNKTDAKVRCLKTSIF